MSAPHDSEHRDTVLQLLARACRDHLSADDCTLIAMVAMRETRRFALLMSAHGGQSTTPEDAAQMMLRIALQIQRSEGGTN